MQQATGDQLEYEHRLQLPFSAIIAGPSGCGKSYFVKRALENYLDVFSTKPDNILWIYSSYQPMYDEMQRNLEIKFMKGIPESLSDQTLFPQGMHHLLILDDVLSYASQHPEVLKLFTELTHHRQISVFYLTQNVFHQGKNSRTISLNTHYMILFKNPRDKQQIGILAGQMFPRQKNFFLESYEDATAPPHGYLLVDFKPNCPEYLRLRTGLLPGQFPAVYIPKR